MVNVVVVRKTLNQLKITDLQQLALENGLMCDSKMTRVQIIQGLLYPKWLSGGGKISDETLKTSDDTLKKFEKKCGKFDKLEGNDAEEAIISGSLPYQDVISLGPIAPDDVIFIKDRCYSKSSLKTWVESFVDKNYKPKTPITKVELTIEDIKALDLDPKSFKYTYGQETTEEKESLMRAVYYGHMYSIKQLVEKGVDINQRLSDNGITSLMIASTMNHFEMVKYLVEKGANINLANNDGYTALMMAINKKNLETVKILVENDANINLADNDGYTALMKATMMDHLETVKILVEKGANINLADYDGFTALLTATHRGNLEIVKYLVEKGADINLEEDNGFTALMVAVGRGNLEMVKYLVEKNAIINLANHVGGTALSMAKWNNGNPEIADYLVKMGAIQEPVKSTSTIFKIVDYVNSFF